jgi:serine/threonine protein kinase
VNYKNTICHFRVPKQYPGKYSFPADVWAIGIISYGLLDGTFPFRDEKQIKEYTPHMPPVSAICIDLVKKFLQKDAKLRPGGLELLKHPWIQDNAENNNNVSSDKDKTAAAEGTLESLIFSSNSRIHNCFPKHYFCITQNSIIHKVSQTTFKYVFSLSIL